MSMTEPESLSTLGDWVLDMGRKGILSMTLVYRMCAAIKRAEILLPDGERNVVFAVTKSRWLRSMMARELRAETARIYVSVLARAVRERRSYLRNPASFTPKLRNREPEPAEQ